MERKIGAKDSPPSSRMSNAQPEDRSDPNCCVTLLDASAELADGDLKSKTDIVTPSVTANSQINKDQNIAHEAIKLLAFLLMANPSTEQESTSNVEQRPGGMRDYIFKRRNDKATRKDAFLETNHDNVIEMLGTTCSILEMMFRHNISVVSETYSSSLCLLLLQVLDQCIIVKSIPSSDADNSGVENTDLGCDRQGDTLYVVENGGAAVDMASEILRLFSSDSFSLKSMSSLPGLVAALLKVIESRASEDSCASCLEVLSHLASISENSMTSMASFPGLVEALVLVIDAECDTMIGTDGATATETSTSKRPKLAKLALRVLSRLSLCRKSQCILGSERKLISVLAKLFDAQDVEACTLGAATLSNIARAEENALTLVKFGGGSLLSVLVNVLRDHERNDESLMGYCIGTLRMVAGDESAVDIGSCRLLIETLADIAADAGVSDALAILASSVLTEISSSINATVLLESSRKLSVDASDELLSGLIKVATADDISVDVQSNIAEAFCVQSQRPDNRSAMLMHDGFFDGLQVLSANKESASCALFVAGTLRNFALDTNKTEELADRAVAECLANILSQANLEQADRTETLKLIELLAKTRSCGVILSKHERFMLTLMKEAIAPSRQEKKGSSNSEIMQAMRETIVLLLSYAGS